MFFYWVTHNKGGDLKENKYRFWVEYEKQVEGYMSMHGFVF